MRTDLEVVVREVKLQGVIVGTIADAIPVASVLVLLDTLYLEATRSAHAILHVYAALVADKVG